MDRVLVKRSDLTKSERESIESAPLGEGEIRVAIDRIGLSSNNVSYASAGDFLGYWQHFSPNEDWGVVPVWGFGTVVESRAEQINLGEKLFGFLPMASEVVFRPSDISDLCFTDVVAQREALHPWYTRVYRCGADPVYQADQEDAQMILWALFMTGWMLADQLQGAADTVMVSSASSKTALSLGWALKQLGVPSVGVTSKTNQGFVTGLDVYSSTVTYDDLASAQVADRVAYVDIAGNAQVTSDVHVLLGDKLHDSVLVGGTHRAPAASPLPMPGPAPRFFFIPDVAEERAKTDGFGVYHQNFARAWQAFLPWAESWMDIQAASGPEAIEQGYQLNVGSSLPPQTALAYSWSD